MGKDASQAAKENPKQTQQTNGRKRTYLYEHAGQLRN